MMTFIAIAIDQAKSAYDSGEVPIGAVLVQGDRIISQTHNLIETTNDPTAHAELLAIREASRKLGTRFLTDCDLYVTLEPCAMCAQAISLARIRRLHFGAYDPKGGAVEHGPRLYNQPTCHHAPEVVGGVMEKECGALLQNFFKDLR